MWSEIEKWTSTSSLLRFGKLPSGWQMLFVHEFASQIHNKESVDPEKEYKMAGVRWYGEGVFHRETVLGKEQSATYLSPLKTNAFIYNRLFAWKESFAVVTSEFEDLYVSNEFPQFEIDESIALLEYVYLLFNSRKIIRAVNAASIGSSAVSRNRFKESDFLGFKVPIPPLPIQQKIVEYWKKEQKQFSKELQRSNELVEKSEIDFLTSLGLKRPIQRAFPKIICSSFKKIDRWSVMYNQLNSINVKLDGGKYPTVPLHECLNHTVNGYSIKPTQRETKHKILKLSSLQPRGLDLSEVKNVKISDKIAERFHLKKDDLLICRSVGSFSHIAKCALVNDDYPNIIFPDIIIRARFNDKIIPEYAREIIQSSVGRAWFQQNARTAVGMWKIGGGDIAAFPMPLPSIEIQQSIVSQILNQKNKAYEIEKSGTEEFNSSNRKIEKLILGTLSVEDL